MKYKTAKVISHPRAGSHFLAHSLNENFFHKKDHLELYAGHGDQHKIHLRSGDTAVFYIYRNNKDTIKSMFKLQDRLGLQASTLKDFKKQTLRQSGINRKNFAEAKFICGDKEIEVNEVDSYLASFPLTPDEYLDYHKYKWLSISKPNYMCIYYDHLINNFQQEMLKIAKFLGSDVDTFIKEKQQVGWYSAKEEPKIFS